MYYVYMLRCRDGSLYTGTAADLCRRMRQHAGGGSACARYTYEYPGVNGVGHFLHTYVQDGNPIPTFQGEPERVAITGTLDAFAGMIWNNLNEANKISLYVRFTDLATGAYQEKLYNKNK